MTTEASEAVGADPAARPEALRRRRAAGRTSALTAAPARPNAAPRSALPARRPHAATGARILAGSLSAATAIGLTAVMAGGSAAGASAAQMSQSAPTVIVVRNGAGVTAPRAVGDGIVSPTVSRAAATPVATSEGS